MEKRKSNTCDMYSLSTRAKILPIRFVCYSFFFINKSFRFQGPYSIYLDEFPISKYVWMCFFGAIFVSRAYIFVCLFFIFLLFVVYIKKNDKCCESFLYISPFFRIHFFRYDIIYLYVLL